MRRTILLTALLLVVPSLVVAQSSQPSSPSTSSASTLLGAQFTPVPELLQIHLPQLQENHGLVIESVKDHSIAKKIGLRPHDIVVKYQSTPIRDVKHFAGLLLATSPGHTSEIAILRKGKLVNLPCTFDADDLPSLPATAVKASGPPAVRLEAQPVESGKFKVSVTCYGTGSKQQTITATGTPAEIETQVRNQIRKQNVGVDVRDLVEVALQRLRDLNK